MDTISVVESNVSASFTVVDGAQLQEAVGVSENDTDVWQEALHEYISTAKYDTVAPKVKMGQVSIAGGAAGPVSGVVRRQGTRFTINGTPWRFAGTNIYGIATQVRVARLLQPL